MSNVHTLTPSVKGRTYTAVDDKGNETVGNTLSARIEQFRAAYRYVDGWSVEITHEFTNIALMSVTNQTLITVLFKASLLLKGVVVETASSLIPIEGNKSWEGGESNARSRLLEVLGFGRYELDFDDQQQLDQVQRLPGPFQAAPTALQGEAPTTPSALKADTTATVVPPTPPKPDTTSGSKKGLVPKAFLTQIQRKCALLSKPVPDFVSLDAAKTFWQDLNRSPQGAAP